MEKKSRWTGLNGDGLSNMCKKISEFNYRRCIEDLINCLNAKYNFMSLQLDVDNRYGLSIIFRYIDSDDESYFYFCADTINCKTYCELFKGFIDHIQIFFPDAKKLFGKTYYEIRMNCDLMN